MSFVIHAEFDNGFFSQKEQPGVLPAGRKGKNSIYAGSLNPEDDPIARKRKEAQEKALNIVRNAWESDKAIDQNIQSRRDQYAGMKKRQEEAEDMLSELMQQKSALKEAYGVEDSSEEQKDLELLEKRQDIENKVIHKALTSEELERLSVIDQKPLTDYQKYSLELNDRAAGFKIDLKDARLMMQDDLGDIRSIKKARLKSDPMVEARNTGDAIMASVNQEIIGMAAEAAKDQIDETQKEAEEKAEEAMDKKEKREERLEALEEKRALEEALTVGTKEAIEEAKAKEQEHKAPELRMDTMVEISKGNQLTGDVQKSLGDIKNSMKLLEADLKGIQVNEEV